MGGEDESNNEESSSSSTSVAKKCEICHQADHKYKCPRCSCRTCSLACCRQHKIDKECSGVRDKTKFVSRDGFDETLLLNDYRFLEENNLLVDTLQRSMVEQCEPQPTTTPHQGGASENLRKFLHKHHGISLRIMPPQSTRRLNNKTRFNKTTGLVSWSVEFVLCVPREKIYVRIDTKSTLFSDKEPLDKLITRFFAHYKLEIMNDEKNKRVSAAYQLDSTTTMPRVRVLFQVADVSKQRKYFVEFDQQKTLEECLKNRSIIEYPSLYLIREEDLDQFEIHREEETQEEAKSIDEKQESSGSEEHPEEEEEDEEIEKAVPAIVTKPVITPSIQVDSEIEDGECDDDDDDDQEDNVESQMKKLKSS